MQYLHSNSILYRDLKAENLLVNANGYLKLSDFGFAVDINDPNKQSQLVGTHEFLAPELLQNKNAYSCSSDWWAFGCLLYEMLTQKLAFYGKD